MSVSTRARSAGAPPESETPAPEALARQPAETPAPDQPSATDRQAPVRIAVLGAGGRGAEAYGRWFVANPEHGRVVAVAELVDFKRDAFADRAGVPRANRFADWRELFAEADRLALDAVVVALPDADHLEPTVAAARIGAAVLLEKPIAPNEDALRDLEQQLEALSPRVVVAHVLRETPFWRAVHRVTSSGALGDLVTIRLEENIGFWHFAHSYVRGNWRRTDISSPMVLAKTSHDLDIIRWLADEPPVDVSSVGSLRHFHEGNAPEGAPSHCVKGCPAAATCPFYAPRYYVDALSDVQGWPVTLLGPDVTPTGRLRALETSPYGRCVYKSDNDVVDHQQSVFAFPSGLTASLTTSAFTGANTRTFQITGTRGELSGHMEDGELRLELFSPAPTLVGDLAPDEDPSVPGWLDAGADLRTTTTGPLGHPVHEWRVLPEGVDDGAYNGHGGGDAALARRFVNAVRSENFDANVTTTLTASLDSHWMAFAAERSRLGRTTVQLDDVRQ
ncbi:Gfo/Idh/MocA family oxidoreductase [Georgenia sp. MJ170]|uniref:Gfo/Idh/MocA family oxidoreductase n=1 Tax=Georgenia sunbinii TaxID=3117728 RepID=UPI002F26D088